MNTPESMDPLFREQLQQLNQVAPPGWDSEAAWEKLTPELPSSSSPRIIPLYWGAASAACLALLLALNWGKWKDSTAASTSQEEITVAAPIQASPQHQVPPTPTDADRSIERAIGPQPQQFILPQSLQSTQGSLAPIERIAVDYSLMLPKQWVIPASISPLPTPSMAQTDRLPVVRFEENVSSSPVNRPPPLNHPLNLNVVRLKPIAPATSQQPQIAVKIPISPTP